MKFYVGVTDKGWFNFLKELKPEEVNFWKPSVGNHLTTLQPGEPFLFKLHHPDNFIVGGGFFVQYSTLPLSMAWEVFKKENGAPDFTSFAARIGKYMGNRGIDPPISCIVLNEPFFFDMKDWIPAPPDFVKGIQQGKYYDTTESQGRDLWTRVEALIVSDNRMAAETKGRFVPDIPEGYGIPYLTSGRLGQGAFSALLMELYNKRCAITGERTIPVLQAAHIRPFSEYGPSKPQNGLLLRADIHILFDKGYITVTPDLHVEVSGKIKEEYENGRDYYKYSGSTLLNFPKQTSVQPSKEFLEWHNDKVFKG